MTFTCQAVIPGGALNTHGYLPVLLAPFIAWRVYYWKRNLIGRQPLRTKRFCARVIIFTVISLAFAAVSFRYPRVLGGLSGGLAAGALVAVFIGLRLTSFETTTEGRFYRPNAYVGAALSVLLIGRLVYRFIMLHSAPPDFLLKYPGRFQSPLTAFLFGLTAGYYIAYYLGVLLRSRKQPMEQ